VRRYVAELRDHFDDLVREETDKGSKQEIAEDLARTRIGSDDELAAVMLALPGLRSLTARFPWAVFGFGPVVMLAAMIVAAVLVEGGFLYSHYIWVQWWGEAPLATPPGWIKSLVSAWNWLITYAAPLLIAALLVLVGERQRTRAAWIVTGSAIICVLGALHDVGIQWPDSPANPSTLSASFALAPPFPTQMMVAGLYRAAINMALVGVGYWLWLRRRSDRLAQ
jgi:hypothetical protein